MKVFHIVSNKVWGGGEQYVYDLCQHLLKDGHDVEVFCRPAPAVQERFKSLNTVIRTLALKGLADVASAVSMSRVLRGCGRCVIHAHNFKDAFTAAFARKLSVNKEIRLIVTRHLVRSGKTSWLYRWLYKQIDSLIFVSERARSQFFSTNPNIDKEKVTIVKNSIVEHTSGSSAENLREAFGIPSDAIVAMFHGRIAEEKGLDILAEAVAEIKEIPLHCILIGTGEEAYFSRLRQHINNLGISDRIHFAGFRSPVIIYLNQADFGLLPSIVSESCGLACLEYMSQGIPMIATNNGGQAEYIHDRVNGLLVEPSSAKALANAMQELANDKTLRQSLSAQAFADYKESMTYDTFYQKIVSIYTH